MSKLVCCMVFLSVFLFALEINGQTAYNELLPHAQLYIDKNKSATMNNIDTKEFKPIHEKILGFGYSPDFHVWIRFTLTNTSQKTIHKIIEYDNPLTSCIVLYDAKTGEQLAKDGLLVTAQERESIHPVFKIALQPKESKTFYIKAYSDITTLIVKLNLWNRDAFYKKELRYQFILALFFGAMGIIVIYNLIIYLSTRERSYLYYVLAFIGIIFYYLIYKGVASVYIFSPDTIARLVKYSSFIVAVPVFFLALFTKAILDLKQYPRHNQILNYFLVVFPLLTVLAYGFDLNQYRSFFSVALLGFLVYVTLFALTKNNRQARFLMVGWLVFFTSGLFMWLSSLGVYDIFVIYPHYTEFSLIAEAVAFSFSLADRLKQLTKEKLATQKELLSYQEKETDRLTQMVKEKTADLEKSLDEKSLLLKELNHRVKNSMQTIIAFLRLQRDDTDSKESQAILRNVENKVFAINDLYALLHTSKNISTVNAHHYFSSLIENMQKSFQNPHIMIYLTTNIDLRSDDVVYCGFILNEAITNSYQHAFGDTKYGAIHISLDKEGDLYHLIIKDNGTGYKQNDISDGLGMVIIDTLASIQLKGEIRINASNGMEIDISWRDNG